MKKFWTKAQAVPANDGWTITLDDRPVRTPAKALLLLPTRALAKAVTAEWQDAPDVVRPDLLPLTAIANAAIDVVQQGRAEIIHNLAAYADADLLCYRADAPAALVELQKAEWDPLLGAVQDHFGIDFHCTSGITHVAQPADTLAKVHTVLDKMSDFQLAALQPLITISGSIILVLAQIEGLITAGAAFTASVLDEDWQETQWGTDTEAQQRLDARRQDYLAASRFLDLLRN